MTLPATPSGCSTGPADTKPADTISADTVVLVRLFAALRERAGWGARSIRLEPGRCTALDLWRQLALEGRFSPDAPALPSGLRVAVNQSFAAPDTRLLPGDEVAFLPPISGG